MTADKSAAAWHPGDGPVKPLDLDGITAQLQPYLDREAKTAPWEAYPFPPDAVRALLAALAAETARADWAVRDAERYAERVRENRKLIDRSAAKLAAVEDLRDKWKQDGEQPDLWIALNRALSAAPTTEQ